MIREVDPQTVTVQGCIALGLLAAEHVAPLLAWRPPARALVQDTIQSDWSWLETRAPDPSRLYWDFMPRLMEEDTALRDDARVAILHVALYAHYYAIWSAEGVTNLERPGTVLSIGNDIADVDESYLAQCLETAVKVSPQPDATTDWLNGLIETMARTQSLTEENVIGPPIRRADFTVPLLPAV